jgi:hypothetical protein
VTLTLGQLGMLAVFSSIGMHLLNLGTSYFFKKITRDDFVTKTSCERCSRQGDTEVKKLTEEIRVMKGILLAIASKAGLPIEALKELVQ